MLPHDVIHKTSISHNPPITLREHHFSDFNLVLSHMKASFSRIASRKWRMLGRVVVLKSLVSNANCVPILVVSALEYGTQIVVFVEVV